MASSQIPVVDILDDDDDDDLAAFASPPSSRKRSHGSAASTSPEDFRNAFSPSPPLKKQLTRAAGDPIVLDDTPSPPKRRPSSSAPKLPFLVVDDDDDDDPLAPDDVVRETPDSVLHCAGFSETPEMAASSSSSLGTFVAETPGFTSPRSVGPNAALGPSSATPAHNFSGLVSPISLDSDDEDDDTMYKNSKSSAECGATLTRMTEVKTKQKEDGAQQIEVKERKQPAKKRLTKEEKAKQMEERKQKQQEDKLKKQALKDELAAKKKMDKEIQKWESGSCALECITAEIDSSIIKNGSIGGPLISSLSANGFHYKPTDNKISGSILWKINVPDDVARELSSRDGRDMNQASVSTVEYISIVLGAEEFCDLISSGSFFNHVQRVRNEYPSFTVCYITNKLMSYINKREQSQYKNNSNTWKRPPVEQVLCKLATHYTNVHSRQCIDEAEVVEHIVGLTSNLAKCKFRKPLTWLSAHSNGAIVSKAFVDKNVVKKDTWLKALIAIPDIQERYAMAIKKKYPCMRSLMNEYMDPSKTVQEKELLLSDLKWENKLGEEAKRLGDKCSRRVYRMLMAQNGDLDTDHPDVGGRDSR